jgi:hypothetical protein
MTNLSSLSTHQLSQILRRPSRLRKTQAPLDRLQILPRHLIAHNMRLLISLVQLFPRTPLMDPHHRHADRPRCLPDAQLEIPVVGGDVVAGLRVADDGADGDEERVEEFLGFESAD